MQAAGEDLIVTSVTVAELWARRRPGGDAVIEAALRYLEYVHPGPPTARLAGQWRASARELGRVLDTPDALIAATAFDLGATVLTRNVRDFELTPVRVETY
jgi:predicted nucleic acid-binding protein